VHEPHGTSDAADLIGRTVVIVSNSTLRQAGKVPLTDSMNVLSGWFSTQEIGNLIGIRKLDSATGASFENR
jgi:hypothetical protein